MDNDPKAKGAVFLISAVQGQAAYIDALMIFNDEQNDAVGIFAAYVLFQRGFQGFYEVGNSMPS